MKLNRKKQELQAATFLLSEISRKGRIEFDVTTKCMHEYNSKLSGAVIGLIREAVNDKV
jgi:hypothetical protein